MSKFVITGVTTATLLGVLALVGVSTVSAYRGDSTKIGPNHTEEREEAMETVMENKDYDGWKELMTQDGRTPGVLRKIDTQEKFDLFSQMYQLQHDGKDASEIREQLGLGQGGMRGNGQGLGCSN